MLFLSFSPVAVLSDRALFCSFCSSVSFWCVFYAKILYCAVQISMYTVVNQSLQRVTWAVCAIAVLHVLPVSACSPFRYVGRWTCEEADKRDCSFCMKKLSLHPVKKHLRDKGGFASVITWDALLRIPLFKHISGMTLPSLFGRLKPSLNYPRVSGRWDCGGSRGCWHRLIFPFCHWIDGSATGVKLCWICL